MTDKTHNKGPAVNPKILKTYETRALKFADVAGKWLKCAPIDSAEKAEKANDFLTGARKLAKEITDRRVLEKLPHLMAGREVDSAFNALVDILTAVADKIKPLQEAYLVAEQIKVDAAAEKARLAAAKEAEAADKASKAAQARNDVAGEVAAEKARLAADKASKAADKPVVARVGSATGGARRQSLRTIRYAEIVDMNQAFLHYREDTEIRAVIEKLANAEIRAAKGADVVIKGIKILTRQEI